MFQQKLHTISKTTAVISFILGSIIFLWYFLTSAELSLLIGFYFIVIAAIVNSVLVLIHTWFLARDQEKFLHLRSFGLLLLNIPIAVIYIYFVLVLLNTVRLTLINETNQNITEIKISGCDEKSIDQLKNEERATLWISIPNDCAIIMTYKLESEEVEEVIYYYTTNMNGQKVAYRIGIDDSPIDYRL